MDEEYRGGRVCKESNLSQGVLQTETSRARREEEIRSLIYQIMMMMMIIMMMMMKMIMMMMMIIIAVTQSIFKLEPPDFAW